MPIKQKSKRFEFEYESPDGDLFVITFIENEDRQYVEIKSDTHDTSQTYDFQMLRDIVHEMEVASDTRTISAHNLPQPQITDHRTGSIDEQVSESLRNSDSGDRPIESFSPGESSAKGELKEWDNAPKEEGIDATELI